MVSVPTVNSILGKRVTIDQEQFRDKAIQLVKNTRTIKSEDSRSTLRWLLPSVPKAKNAARMEMQTCWIWSQTYTPTLTKIVMSTRKLGQICNN